MQTLRQPIVTSSVRPYLAQIRLFADFLLHSHDEMEIVLLLSGRASYTVDGRAYEMTAGDVILIAPNLIHAITLPEGSEPVQGMILECGYAMFGDDYELLRGKMFSTPLQQIFRPETPLAKQLGEFLTNILCELPFPVEFDCAAVRRLRMEKSSDIACDSAVRAQIFALFTWLVRSFPLQPVQSNGLTQAQKLRWSNVFDYIAAHYHESIRVEQAAALSGYSLYHFSRCFREYTGIPFHQYLNRYRIEKALLMLADRSVPITQIAEQSGFESIKTFNRVFKLETGCSPSAYRVAQQQRVLSSPEK